jgi:predicted RNase H-like HicB family nuclease
MTDTIQVSRAEYEALRKISERWDLIETLMYIGDVELRQDEDGGYSVSVEPVENILAQRWTGNSPEEVIDSAISAINMPANGEGEKSEE